MANTEQNENTPESYGEFMVDVVSSVAKETGWSIEEILDMSPMELFTFTKSIVKQYNDGKNSSEFLGTLSNFKGILG